MRTNILVGLVLVLSLVLAAGCAKKKVEAEPVMQEEKAVVVMEKETMTDSQLVDPMEAAQRRDEAVLTENKIFFDYDKYDLKPIAKDTLKEKAAILKKYAGWKMLIEGHCDERGTEEYNLALGERRARAAYEFMVLLGVDSTRLKIVSFGEERPVDPSDTETAWAKNRRDEFKVFK